MVLGFEWAVVLVCRGMQLGVVLCYLAVGAGLVVLSKPGSKQNRTRAAPRCGRCSC